MKENEASLTAMMTAYMRAYHAMHDTPKIFDDSLAYHLIPEEKRALIKQYLTWDKQLSDPESASSRSDQTNTFEPLIQRPMPSAVHDTRKTHLRKQSSRE